MADRFEDIRAFISVAEAGSFAAAADRLGIAKSAVSRRIRDFEDRLGVQLIQRTTRQLNLTENGRALLERGQRLLADLEETEAIASVGQAEPRGSLRVSAPMSFGARHLGPAIGAFLRKHPDLMIDIELNDRESDLVAEGFDIAVRIGELRESSLIARRIAPIRRVAVASPEYLARKGHPSSPHDLLQHRGLNYSNINIRDYWALDCGRDDRSVINIPQVLRSNNGDMLLAAAISGAGIAVLPTFLVCDALRNGDLRHVLPDNRPPETQLSALYPSSRNLSNKVRVFVDFLVATFGPEPYWDRETEPRT